MGAGKRSGECWQYSAAEILIPIVALSRRAIRVLSKAVIGLRTLVALARAPVVCPARDL